MLPTHQVGSVPIVPTALHAASQALGVKGVGEGSAISPPVAIANAVSDALSSYKMEFNSTPVRPEQIARAIMGLFGAEGWLVKAPTTIWQPFENTL